MMEPRTLTIENLIIGYNYPLCQVPSLVVQPGQAVRIQAPNGMGKTTLLRTLYGLLPPLSGSFRLSAAGGVPECTGPSRTCFCPSAAALPDDGTCRQALDYWAHLEGVEREQVRAIADRLGLNALLDLPTQQFSSGQQRRLALTRALASGADLLLFDEPFAALDAKYAAIVEAMITSLAQERLVLYVAHDRQVTSSKSIELAVAPLKAQIHGLDQGHGQRGGEGAL